MQTTVPAAYRLKCCILCNVQFSTSSAGYSSQDLTIQTRISSAAVVIIVMLHQGCEHYISGSGCSFQCLHSTEHWLYLWVNTAPFLSVGLICQRYTSNSDLTQIICFFPSLAFSKSIRSNMAEPLWSFVLRDENYICTETKMERDSDRKIKQP